MKKLLSVFKIVFIVVLIGWLILKFDVTQAKQVIAAADLRWAFAALAGMVIGWYIYAYRWAILVRAVWPDIKLSLFHYLWYCLVAGFYNLFIPTFVSGEVVRVVKLGAHVNKEYLRCTLTVAVERLLAVFLWFIFFLISPSHMSRNVYFWMVLPVAGFAALYFFRDKLRSMKKDLLSVYLNNPGNLVKAGAVSASGQFVYIIVNFAAFKCFGIDIPFFDAIGLISLGVLSGIIPISLMGIGLKEGVFITLLPAYGASSAQILMAVGFMVFLFYLNGIAGGLIELAHAGWKLSSLRNVSYTLEGADNDRQG